jgi:hypothetical protein
MENTKQRSLMSLSFAAFALKRDVISFVVIRIRAIVMVMQGNSLSRD